MTKQLSDRAKHRLELAANLVRYSPAAATKSPGAYLQIQNRLASMSSEHREQIRACVDWVEGYEGGELAFVQSQPRS